MDAVTRLQWEIAELEALVEKYRNAGDEETLRALKLARIQIQHRRDKLALWLDVPAMPATVNGN